LNPDERRAPASMVKMIMLLLVDEGLAAGSWALDTPITVSTRAQSIGGTQVRLKAGETWTLNHLMRAVAVASANDAAVAVAEGLWGSEEAYLKRANERARELGMLDTTFCSVHGLPPDPGQLPDQSTARDLAILARACVAREQILKWAGEPSLTFREGADSKPNTNKLIGRMAGCDGLKTGYTKAAGFCIAATAVRNDIRLVAIVLGCPKLSDRFTVAERLLEDGFAETRREKLVAKGEPIPDAIRTRNAKVAKVYPVPKDDLWVTARDSDFQQMRVTTRVPGYLQAPQPAGVVIGAAQVELGGHRISEVPLTLPINLEVADTQWKLVRSIEERLKPAR
jgi:D-alanyl-D-alanine carboxypeptidase (penicillin-binding protein 5/6)